MRDILNQLEIIAESVGLANRKPGTLFANPQGDELVFQGLEFYPKEGGSYRDAQETGDILGQVCQQLGINPNIIEWTNQPPSRIQPGGAGYAGFGIRSEEHTSELQSH